MSKSFGYSIVFAMLVLVGVAVNALFELHRGTLALETIAAEHQACSVVGVDP